MRLEFDGPTGGVAEEPSQHVLWIESGKHGVQR